MVRRLTLALLACLALILGGAFHAAERAAPNPLWLDALCSAGDDTADPDDATPAHCPDCLMPATLAAGPAAAAQAPAPARRRTRFPRHAPARVPSAQPWPPARGPPSCLS
jgi:hypothetical protein